MAIIFSICMFRALTGYVYASEVWATMSVEALFILSNQPLGLVCFFVIYFLMLDIGLILSVCFLLEEIDLRKESILIKQDIFTEATNASS
mmetsp:Transcript_9936/g.19698  ORF Transcript_9936/g.19698 Transcript_9936/m.19698 type:complete len:90 (-) Transcript_9936:32-301(-)